MRGKSVALALKPYCKPGPLGVFALGVSSGFPLALVLATLSYWLAKQGIDKRTVGLFAAVTFPYAVKFLWAPLIDAVRLPLLGRWFGQRRAWLFLVQLLLLGAIVMLGASDPSTQIWATARWAFIVALLSATQDIVIDAYRIEILSEAEQAYGAAMINFGYRTGLLAAGAGTILVSGVYGWPAAYALTGLLLLPGGLAALLIGEPRRAAASSGRDWLAWLNDTLIAPFAQFLRRDQAWLILAFILIYKAGDAIANTMLAPLVVELGFSDQEVVWANKVAGFWALIAGGALGGPLVAWIGMGRALLLSGLFMMLTNLGFSGLALAGHDSLILTLTIGFENFASGVGLTVFVAYLSGLCNVAYTATQYAALSSLAAVARTLLPTPAGYLATALGWPLFFVASTLLALPGLLLLWLLWRRRS